jgi:hypothetical protein
MSVAEFDEAGAFGVFGDAHFEADIPHLIVCAAGWAHEETLEVRIGCGYLASPLGAAQRAIARKTEKQVGTKA